MSVMWRRPSITAQIHERTEVGDILDNTLADLPNIQFGHEMLSIFFSLLLDKRTAANDDISSRIIDLETSH